nr:hypothetical protein [Streptomyces sp. 846.5]
MAASSSGTVSRWPGSAASAAMAASIREGPRPAVVATPARARVRSRTMAATSSGGAPK